MGSKVAFDILLENKPITHSLRTTRHGLSGSQVINFNVLDASSLVSVRKLLGPPRTRHGTSVVGAGP